MKILAAMSGGVDSAVAAARAVDAGHEVVGVHLALSRMPGTLRTGSRGCCTIEDSQDAWRACERLGIPFYVWDFSERFKEDVVDDFVAEYAAGRTPNPCMRCNEKIKFAALLDKAVALGFDAVATGHYARLTRDADGRPELHRSSDWAKDQSYVLGVLTEEQLNHCLFPLDDVESKAHVRAEAEARGLAVAKKPDSYDICFIPDGDTRGWLEERIEMEPGAIVTPEGERLGEHRGAQAFTVGQRKGLALGRPAPDGKPRFVLEIRPKTNEVVVGPERLLAVDTLTGRRVSWAGRPVPEAEAGLPFEVHVQVRAHGDPEPATARVAEGDDGAARLVVDLHKPMRGVAPGQTMVIYSGTRVLGQATLESARSAEFETAARAD
ncbi:tRNA 2-thiouridine(34) synthase MnmA [Falsarthrobacter nasiphocae]|uniref:tRNA-specific 2-thiouridylase MnmA n=1 Tax=Falsarthrobacter nasiphocae TaxID=189863 RepID=A0AAE3YFS5_9MICC|nr:tRNA 2-thiouridine(34) synthase MnmA [Falsarthrobacter nasiphocae]MDR6891432.1 tRNA-specific 2-thiouridylase [Falsarthrobacter nasiphocae]